MTEHEEQRLWRETVIDALVAAGIYAAQHDADPRKALSDLIAWEVEVALSPTVSKGAAALIARSRQQALEESAAEAESWKGQKLRLMAGEMSGPELRAARTVTTTIARVLRNRAEVTGETS